MRSSHRLRLVDGPEINIGAFGFLLNFAWEMWQAPLFEDMARASHLAALVRCTLAALGDAVILVAAFLAIALWAGTRAWALRPRRRHVLAFVGLSLAITIALEKIAIAALIPGWTWAYGAAMPVIPLIEIGAAPFAQWLVLPLTVLRIVKRQLR